MGNIAKVVVCAFMMGVSCKLFFEIFANQRKWRCKWMERPSCNNMHDRIYSNIFFKNSSIYFSACAFYFSDFHYSTDLFTK